MNNIKIAKELIKLAKSIVSDNKFYRGINKQVDTPYENKNNFVMFVTDDIDYAKQYAGDNGSLFEIDINYSQLNIADEHDIITIYDEMFGEDINDNIQDMMLDYDKQLIDILKQNGFNAMEFQPSNEYILCIFDKKFIKNFNKIK